MKSMRFFTLLILISLSIFACDKDPNVIFDAAFDRLQPELDAASNKEKISLLEAFEKKHEGHPKIEMIRKQIDSIQSMIDEQKAAEEKKKNRSGLEKSFDKLKKGAMTDVLSFAISSLALKTTTPGKKIDLVKINSFGNTLEFEKAAQVSPQKLRSSLARTIHNAKEDKSYCNISCQNEFANTILKKQLGGNLFEKNGKLNPKMVSKLLSSMDHKLLGGVKRSALKRLYGPTINRALKVRESIRKIGDKKVMKSFNELQIKGETINDALLDWYNIYPNEQESLKKLHSPRDPVSDLFSFWIRRMDDKSADQIEAFLKKFVEKE